MVTCLAKTTLDIVMATRIVLIIRTSRAVPLSLYVSIGVVGWCDGPA